MTKDSKPFYDPEKLKSIPIAEVARLWRGAQTGRIGLLVQAPR